MSLTTLIVLILTVATLIYLVITLLVGLMINLLPLTGWALALRPDFVALVLLYWGLHQPHRIGFLPAWLLGLRSEEHTSELQSQ